MHVRSEVNWRILVKQSWLDLVRTSFSKMILEIAEPPQQSRGILAPPRSRILQLIHRRLLSSPIYEFRPNNFQSRTYGP